MSLGLLYVWFACQSVALSSVQLQYLLFGFLCVHLSIMALYVSILSILISVYGCLHLHMSTS